MVSVYVEPPLEEPPPVRVEWAPPPMLVEDIPPPPADDAVWTGGYWVWRGDWVWAHGRWARPPRHGYRWQNPYYEHRGNTVVFIDGYWCAADSNFVAPPRNADIALAIIAAGVLIGARPRGPEGVFVPPPPGSHRGLIVPAPLGTAPAVVTGAPPIIREGMRITGNNNIVNNIGTLTIVAPASATANGRPLNVTVPARAHLAAAQTPLVRTAAPPPASATALPPFLAGRPLPALPPTQNVRAQAPPSLQRPLADKRPSQQHVQPPEARPAPIAGQAHAGAAPAGRANEAPRVLTAPPAASQAPQQSHTGEHRRQTAVDGAPGMQGNAPAPHTRRADRNEARPAAQSNNAQPTPHVMPMVPPAAPHPPKAEAMPPVPASPAKIEERTERHAVPLVPPLPLRQGGAQPKPAVHEEDRARPAADRQPGKTEQEKHKEEGK